MNDEIKEALEEFKSSYYAEITHRQYELILDYITNLQEKLKVSQTNEETYRLEMQDITKCLGLDEDKIFDEVKEYATNLQKYYYDNVKKYEELLLKYSNLQEKINQKNENKN